MPRNLLITAENGRPPTTYGLKRTGTHTMNFALVAAVVVLASAGGLANGDLEIYPGVQREREAYNAPEENADQFRFYLDPRWRASIPWDNRDDQEYYKPSQYVEADLSERVRQFVNRRREQLIQAAKENPDFKLRFSSDYQKAPLSGYERYRLKYPNQQILDDVRPYPHEDSDFSFRDGEGGEGEAETEAEEEPVEEAAGDQDKWVFVEKEASGKGALDVKAVDPPADFAYAPPDPRFYDNVLVNPAIQQKQELSIPVPLKNLIIKSTTEDGRNEYFIAQRNKGKFLLSQIGQYKPQKQDREVEVVAVRPRLHDAESAGVYIIAVVAGISAAATVGLIAFAIGWYNLQKHVKNASDVEYPAYGVTGPNKEVSPSGDRRLAQSAQMYHYQHQKQQIIAMESRAAANERHGSISEADSDEENEEGDYTVYECPGLAPTGEMEVKNPLFQDDPTPAQTPQVKPGEDTAVPKK